MAITAITTPSAPTLAYQPIIFKLESDEATIVNLIVEVFISIDGGLNGDRVAAISVSPDLGTVDEFTFDIQEIVKKHVSFKLKTLGSSTVLNDIDNIEFRLHVFEVVLTNGILVTNYDPDTPSSGFQYLFNFMPSFNWRESHLSLANFNKVNYQLNGLTKKFLSEAPTTKDIELGANEFLGMAWTESSGGLKNYLIKILTYNSLGALLNTDNLSVLDWNNLSIVSSYTKPYLDVPVGTANLIAMGVSLTNVAKYTIQLISDDGIRSEVKSYNIVDSCPSDARIHFINKFGKQDSITLKGNQIEGIAYKSATYEKALSTTYSASDFGRAVIHNELERNFTAYSKSIGRDVLNFANTMLVTRTAWIEINNNYFSILIDEGSKVVRNEEDMPIQFVLNFSLANNEKGHKL